MPNEVPGELSEISEASGLPTDAPAASRRPALPASFWFMVAMFGLVIGIGTFVAGRELGLIQFDSAAARPIRGEAPAEPPAPPLLCADVAAVDQAHLERGFAQMVRTPEGRALFDQLVVNGVCTGVTTLDYAAAYAQPNPGLLDWSGSVIMVDETVLRTSGPDILAATLVHEAKHIARAINGEACGLANECTILENGVAVEEEMEAHAAEARWWLEIYGAQGRRVAAGGGYWMDNLVLAYRRGPEAFRAYVIDIRSDPRDGQI